MNDVIVYQCKCGKDNSLVPDFAKYLLQFMEMEKRAIPMCTCGIPVPVKRLYSKYLKTQN